MDRLRTPYQGVWNIVLFNWPFYVVAIALGIGALWVGSYLGGLVIIVFVLAALQIGVSLGVSYWIYDRSDLYSLRILDEIESDPPGLVVNIHAGFDETSGILRGKLPESQLLVWDFYDPDKHTEPSIRRARVAYPPNPAQTTVVTDRLPLSDNCADLVCLILAAHEIRSQAEQDAFFGELHRILAPRGRIVLIEHLRDFPNFLAFSLGFFHFYPRSHWRNCWQRAELRLVGERKITPFLSAFVLAKS